MKEYGDFSVLISVYIKEKPEYLDRALKSILIEQELFPKEVVLVEDGPLTEKLNNVIENYKKKFSNIIKSVKLEENQGLGIALNKGLENCRFDIIARMDTDDIALSKRFKIQYNFFVKNNYDVVGSNIIEFEKDENNIISYKIVPENHEEIVKYSKKRNPINHPSVMFKKEAVLNCESYLDMPGFEDYYLWIRMIMNGYKFYNIQEPLLKFRTGIEMIKRRGSIKYIKYEKNFFKQLYKDNYISNLDFKKEIAKRIIFRIIPEKLRLKLYKVFLRKKFYREV